VKHHHTLGFIGGGFMAEAIIKGILTSNLLPPSNIHVGELNPSRQKYLENEYGINTTSNNISIIDNTKIIILAIKPQIFSHVANEIKSFLSDTQTIISILAGTRIQTLTKSLMHNHVIRIMPNTPVQIGHGMSVWTSTKNIDKNIHLFCSNMLQSIGEEIYIDDENFIDLATAISASGPAYVFLFIEALIDTAIKLGATPDIAHKLVTQTVLGSTILVNSSKKSPSELREAVTSPGGGTAEALNSFEMSDFRGVITKAVNSAYEKYKELGKTT
jgi:pyrroline-5-carboxylate reductase